MLPKKNHLQSLIQARHSNPHAVLGMHFIKTQDGKSGIRVAVFRKGIKSCEVIDCKNPKKKIYPMEKLAPEGYFEVFIPRRRIIFKYRLRITYDSGYVEEFFDPYAYVPTLSNQDLYLFNEGTHYRIYERLGSHNVEIDGIKGFAFAVWAPNAQRVSVVGDFNFWDGRYYPMRSMGSSGVWELFIPELKPGFKYKYEIIDQKDNLLIKTDPFAIYFESPPNNASIAHELNYAWNDQHWIEKRQSNNWDASTISIYEVHLGSWKRHPEDNRSFNYREIAADLAEYVKKMGFTHVEFMPLMEHPFAASWGYQVTGFYAPCSRYGSPEDFMYLVDILHQHNIGVIMDWVPGHFPKDDFALAKFDGTCLYEHANPKQGEHPDWGTLIFNYGRKEVSCFLIGSALSWIDRFHIDGLRVDAVASMLYLDYSRKSGEWIPNPYGGRENIEALEFLRSFNDLVHFYFPGVITIAEESTAFSGLTKPTRDYGLGFDFKWNMGWMHDNINYFSKDPIYRKYHHNNLTFGMLYQYSENFIQVFSHDEVVHSKGSMITKMAASSMTEKAQNLRALYTYMWLWPGKKTLFMGSEFGQSSEWNYDASLDWHLLQYQDHQGVQDIVRDLNYLYHKYKSLSAWDSKFQGFQWIYPDDADNSVISFLRLGLYPKDTFFLIGNFTPVPRNNYRIGVPFDGHWIQLINSNSSKYGGTNHPNSKSINAEHIPFNGRDYSICLDLPSLTTLVYKHDY